MEENTPLEALLIVHLSSLDSYTYEKGLLQGKRLSDRIVQAIKSFPDLVFVTDQQWKLIGTQSQPRRVIEESLQDHARVVRFYRK